MSTSRDRTRAEPNRERTTDLLVGSDGSSDAQRLKSEELASILYDELRRMAARHIRRERTGHTLQATDLVHEVYLRLFNQDRLAATDRLRFLGLASRIMRQVLVDHARRRKARKRGGHGLHVTLDEARHASAEPAFDLLELEQALQALHRFDPRAASVVELRIFGGMTREEAAQYLGVSERTITGDWSFARRWLQRELSR